MVDRREFLVSSSALATGLVCGAATATAAPKATSDWNAGDVAHLIPMANHQRFLIKASFKTAHFEAPSLVVAGRKLRGRAGDTQGYFWTFDAQGLEPGRPYRLQLLSSRGSALCDPWLLSTFPAPNDTPKTLRLLIYSCAGGHDVLPDHQPTDISKHRFLTLEVRRRMLARGMSFAPDAVIANGDHIYWDLRTVRADRLGMSKEGVAYAGVFDRTQTVFGSGNENVLKRSVGPQIADLYGTTLRSTPAFFLQDDHDYFENDEADDKLVTFPPDAFSLNLARAAQMMYYPEFLPDANRALGLASACAADRQPGVSESFGTLRYGKLLEFMLYDCRRYMTLTGPSGGFVPPLIEDWLKSRMASSDAAHVINMPSTPVGWSAGKWGEWYADIDGGDQRLSTRARKPYWQSGWRLQHDRLLNAASGMRSKIPLFVGGDLHALGEARILRSGEHDLRANPVVSMLPGPLGTGRPGWPSLIRGLRGLPPAGLEVEEGLPTLEENGFTIAELTSDRIVLKYFRWKLGRPESDLDTLQPFRVTELKRQG